MRARRRGQGSRGVIMASLGAPRIGGTFALARRGEDADGDVIDGDDDNVDAGDGDDRVADDVGAFSFVAARVARAWSLASSRPPPPPLPSPSSRSPRPSASRGRIRQLPSA